MTKSKDEYFIPENRNGDPVEKFSPSGKYKLVVEVFSTGKNTWAYSQGTVYKDNEIVGQIRRNYAAFPFAWVENHPNGHDYLIGGEDYQGQTVIELDTGKRRELLPEEAKKGHGFCWASYKYIPEHQLLFVSGCYWACPYEFRFYNFSDPMNGWPQLHVVGTEYDFIDDSPVEPTIKDGIVTVPQAIEVFDWADRYPDLDKKSVSWLNPQTGEVVELPEDCENDCGDNIYTIVASISYSIGKDTLTFLKEDVTPHEAEYRERCRIEQEKYRAWKKEFEETDSLYLAFVDGCKKLNTEIGIWTGYTHDRWCPDHQFQEARWGQDVYNKNDCRITIEWGIKTGPVKLEIKGKNPETKFWMEHSVESIKSAFDYANEVVRGLL